MGNMASFLNISPDSSFGFVCLIDCLEALSLWRGPWLFIASVTYAGNVEVRALCCQYVWMMAGSLKAP